MSCSEPISARYLLWLVAIGAASVFAPSDSRAAEVDCGTITMQFTGAGYSVDCEAESDTLRADTATGGGLRELLTATANDESNFLMAFDVRATGNIYYTHQSLYNRTKNYFSDTGLRDWHKGADFADFEVAEFNGSVRSHESECVAFQRSVNRVPGGYQRVVFGIGCSLQNRAQVYDALKMLDAPGD